MSVIKAMQEMGLTVISTATELVTGSIHIRGKRGDGLKLLQSLIHRGGLTMTSKIDLSSLSHQDLSALEQEILAEESRRVMNSSTAIVVEPEAPERSHQDAIAKLIECKSQNP